MALLRTASEEIIDEVGSWPGIDVGPGGRGELAFKLGRRQIGHLHGDRAAHFSFPKEVWNELLASGRISEHPVFPGKVGPAARAIRGADDVRDVIALLRINYERMTADAPPQRRAADIALPYLHATQPQALSFAPNLEVRAFLLRRERGNIVVYSTAGLTAEAMWIRDLGGVARHYLNHAHEAMLAPGVDLGAPLFVHSADRGAVETAGVHVRGSFSQRHRLDDDFEIVPIPGHTPGATAYLWDTGQHRLLFTGDTIHLHDDEWTPALLPSSDRDAYIASLELIAGLEFDVLVPWAATRGGPYLASTDRVDAQRRIAQIIERLRAA